MKHITLEELGWDEFFEAHRVELGLDPIYVARVTTEQRGVYRVKNSQGEYSARVTGKHMYSAVSKEDYPAVGDWVVISYLEENKAVIERIMPRKTLMKRKQSGSDETQVIATNIDCALIVESFDRDFSLNRFERFISLAYDGGIPSALIVNKVDTISKKELEMRVAQLRDRFKESDIILTSTLTSEGLDTLQNYIVRGKTYCFLGSSGVGKSSLINGLLGKNTLKTGEVGVYSGRGKHVTTAREMYFLQNGGMVIDNPGVREVGMTDGRAGVEDVFEEIAGLGQRCQFVDCSHTQEPGCAVLLAVQSGALNNERYQSYLSLKKEADHYGRTKLEKKQKDRQFGKIVKKAKKELRKFNFKGYGE